MHTTIIDNSAFYYSHWTTGTWGNFIWKYPCLFFFSSQWSQRLTQLFEFCSDFSYNSLYSNDLIILIPWISDIPSLCNKSKLGRSITYEIWKRLIPQNNLLGKRNHNIEFFDPFSFWFSFLTLDSWLYPVVLPTSILIFFLHCMMNILEQMKKFPVELMNQLIFNTIY